MIPAVTLTGPCNGCLHDLVTSTAEATGAAPERQQRAIACALKIIEQLRVRPFSPAHVANRVHPVIAKICRTADPFRQRKRIEVSVARRLAKQFRPGVNSDLAGLMLFAARGNAIDFFRPISELEGWLRSAPTYGLQQMDRFLRRLNAGSRRVLWLADNAGELFFDLPAVRRLTDRGHSVTYAVKSGPVQNDLSLADFRDSAVDILPAVLTGTGAASVGLELDRTTADFRRLYQAADLVVAKGMGHFETLWGHRDPRILFLFMAKCDPVAAAVGVRKNQLVACFEKNPSGTASARAVPAETIARAEAVESPPGSGQTIAACHPGSQHKKECIP